MSAPAELWTAERIVLKYGDINALRDAARSTYPFEACALLLGRVSGSEVEVTDIVLVENADRSAVSFHIDPQILLKIYRRADDEGKEVVSVFHSHPAPPSPSAMDVEFMQSNPVVWLVLSTSSDQFGAYQLQGGAVKQVKIVVRP